MNYCFFICKVVTEVDFRFCINNKKDISMVTFKVELTNKSIINVKAYNEKADFCYKNIKTNNVIMLQGNLTNNYEIEMCACNRL